MRDWLCECGKRHTGVPWKEDGHAPVSVWEARMAQLPETSQEWERRGAFAGITRRKVRGR